MANQFKDYAKKVLSKVNVPLTFMEIWKKGQELGFEVETDGKTPFNTLGAQLFVDVRDNPSSEFIKVGKRPARFFLKSKKDEIDDSFSLDFLGLKGNTNRKSAKFTEEDIYEPAKSWFVDEGEEVTHACVLGGKVLGHKWGTPDILATIRPKSDDFYKPHIELVAIEVKDPGYSPVEALGQAMAYKYFAHKVWLVLPKDDEINRIEGIAISANIGLVVFEKKEEGFHFEFRNRPLAGQPDFTEVNAVLKILKEKKLDVYNALLINA
jgi:hypothetical protein